MIQGHGEVVLRGEVEEVIDNHLDYLRIIREHVASAIERGEAPEALDEIPIEDCGKSRIPLNGLVQDLHQANMQALYAQLMAEHTAH